MGDSTPMTATAIMNGHAPTPVAAIVRDIPPEIDAVAEGLLSIDRAGRISYVNEAAERMLGYTGAELVGRTLRDGLLVVEDNVFQRKDGTKLVVALNASPLCEDANGSNGHVLVFQDINEAGTPRDRSPAELEALSWLGWLREAIDEDRLMLAAQPIISLTEGKISRHELLVRLRDRAGRLVPPGKFLPVAEQFGLIRELDRWVILHAARLAARGHAVNVNLSANSLGDPDLAVFVENTLREEGAEPARFAFELTETALMEQGEIAGAFVDRMSAGGCDFALDDFGTGYGCFTYLQSLPIGYLKIDREFVLDLRQNPASAQVVEAVVGLARVFGQKTVAEGVEDELTLELLRGLGVDYAQGYHLGRPKELKETKGRTT